MAHYKALEPAGAEGIPVQFAAVHVVRWRREWGEPTLLFVEDEDPLVAAAPKLLQACGDALDSLEYIERAHPGLSGYGVRQGSIAQLRAAIAKAKGEQR